MSMPQRVDSFDLATLGLSSGEARALDLDVAIEELAFGGQTYSAGGSAAVRLDVSRTMAGYALRLRFEAVLAGPCMRCLEVAGDTVEVDAREIDQPGDAEELQSPYVEDSTLELRAWARDALALALPTQIFCREECRGLCPRCGADLNAGSCECAPEAEESPWGALKKLKFD